jgi:predicted hotdog family 3-hydroxylacyl-ACP dehydratase
MSADAVETIDVERVIPHRLPMRLVEEIERVDETSIATTATVRATWPTAQDGMVRTVMLVELVAQTAAALQGWKERHEHVGKGGLLVGIPSALPAASFVPIGTALRCSVRITHGVPSYLAFDGEVVAADGTRWMTASIQAYRPDEAEPTGVSP